MARDGFDPGEIREVVEPEQPVRERKSALDRVAETDPSDLISPEQAEALDREYEAWYGPVAEFEPDQANVPEVSGEQAADYIRDNAGGRPWLKPAERCVPDIQRVIAAFDQGSGHFVERHEGYANGERLERRAAALEDPAQLNPERRAEGKDAEKPERLHGCEELATSIDDPNAFAVAAARAVQHPTIKAILDRPREPHESKPGSVQVPIEDLLDEYGHFWCAGYRLLPIDGDINAAKDNRKAWVEASPEQRASMTAPRTEPIPPEDFQGGTMVFTFCRTPDFSHWEIRTFYPKPRG